MTRGPRACEHRHLFFELRGKYHHLNLATLRLLQETRKLSSGKISARYVLMQVRYSRLQLLFAYQGPHTVQLERADIIRSQREIKKIFDPEYAPFH